MEFKDWNEIYEGGKYWESFSMRCYDGVVYFETKKGWVSLDDITEAIEDLLRVKERLDLKELE